ncbi:MAG: 30S ribosomal protein S17 [Dehalococcoidia bacterium]
MVEAATTEGRVINRKARTGTVVSDRGDQTIIVAIERAAPHRLYRKVIRRTKRYPVHDPQNAASVGDLVRIEECRPISKTKRWRLVEIVQQREVAQVRAEAIDASLVTEVQRAAAHAAAQPQAAQNEAETQPEPAAQAASTDAEATAEPAPAPEAAAETATETESEQQ